MTIDINTIKSREDDPFIGFINTSPKTNTTPPRIAAFKLQQIVVAAVLFVNTIKLHLH